MQQPLVKEPMDIGSEQEAVVDVVTAFVLNLNEVGGFQNTLLAFAGERATALNSQQPALE